jgi:hypothetical protein
MTDKQAIDIAAKLSPAQRKAILEGRVHDCPYNHPAGTRCPNCSDWPFKKGEAAAFVATMKAHLEEQSHG